MSPFSFHFFIYSCSFSSIICAEGVFYHKVTSMKGADLISMKATWVFLCFLWDNNTISFGEQMFGSWLARSAKFIALKETGKCFSCHIRGALPEHGFRNDEQHQKCRLASFRLVHLKPGSSLRQRLVLLKILGQRRSRSVFAALRSGECTHLHTREAKHPLIRGEPIPLGRTRVRFTGTSRSQVGCWRMAV